MKSALGTQRQGILKHNYGYTMIDIIIMSDSDFVAPASPILMRHSAIVGLEPTELPYKTVFDELKLRIEIIGAELEVSRTNARSAFVNGDMTTAHKEKEAVKMLERGLCVIGRVREMLELAAIWLMDEIPATQEAAVIVRAIVFREMTRLFMLSPEELRTALVDYDIASNLKREIRSAFVTQVN